MSNKPDARLELGRRLLAAVLSIHYRLSSVDYTLREYVPEEVDPSWGELGLHLQRGLAVQISSLLHGKLSN
jgi:hypothetical protein